MTSETADHSGLVMDINYIISQNLVYTVFSTVGAFYLPLAFIVAVYLNVYRVARSRIHRRQFNRRRGDDDRPGPLRDASTIDPDIDMTTQSHGVVWQALRSRLNAISNRFSFSLDGFVLGPDPSVIGQVWYMNDLYLSQEDWMALRSRLNAISLGLPSTTAAASLPASRTSSVDDGNLRRTGSTSTSAADRKVFSSQPPQQQQQQQQQLLQPPTPRQFLSVDNGPRLSESSSAPSSASSSRGGSWVYFTRYA